MKHQKFLDLIYKREQNLGLEFMFPQQHDSSHMD